MVEIKVLGTGCARCNELEKLCYNVAAENNIDADIKKVSDLKEIMSYGIMQTPGLVINGKVKISGKLPTSSTLLNWMKEN
ncbi:MAG: TM0996/MTH895 family glutaredoxin-like protein [Ignavibacteriae bacterium]|nr:TM0996/MTH895 family glutaredoxin-like protein [Ignavibacteriota bacterium]